MRSVYLAELAQTSPQSPALQEGSRFVLEEDKTLHHLLHVVRLQPGEKLLLLDGRGRQLLAEAELIQKKKIVVKIERVTEERPRHPIEVGLGILKKDAWEEALKACVELGVRQLIPLMTEFSGIHLPSPERSARVIESALIQSNNPYFLPVADPLPLRQLPFPTYQRVYYFSSSPIELVGNDPGAGEVLANATPQGPLLALVGPEGGMSRAEEEWLLGQPQVQRVHLPTYILRAPHAVLTAVGFIIALQSSNRSHSSPL